MPTETLSRNSDNRGKDGVRRNVLFKVVCFTWKEEGRKEGERSCSGLSWRTRSTSWRGNGAEGLEIGGRMLLNQVLSPFLSPQPHRVFCLHYPSLTLPQPACSPSPKLNAWIFEVQHVITFARQPWERMCRDGGVNCLAQLLIPNSWEYGPAHTS